MRQAPAFVGIGAQKAATSWLWTNLRTHPQLWMPPLKELHWFDTRLVDSGYRHRRGLARCRRLIRRPTLANAIWFWRFYNALENASVDTGYRSLFPRNDDRMTGEITPAYAILDKEIVEQIHRILPDHCRIIFCMREPVGRLWSQLRMECARRKVAISDLDESGVDALAKQPGNALRSNYAFTLDNWSLFGDRLGLFFYEDILENPADFLAEVFRFLDVDPSWRPRTMHRAINVGHGEVGPPEPLASCWRQEFAPLVQYVKGKAGRVPVVWE